MTAQALLHSCPKKGRKIRWRKIKSRIKRPRNNKNKKIMLKRNLVDFATTVIDPNALSNVQDSAIVTFTKSASSYSTQDQILSLKLSIWLSSAWTCRPGELGETLISSVRSANIKIIVLNVRCASNKDFSMFCQILKDRIFLQSTDVLS